MTSSPLATRLAFFAVSGLLAGIAACSAAAPATGEVVVPAPPENTAGTDATVAVDDTAEEPAANEPAAPKPRTKRQASPPPPTKSSGSKMCCRGLNECKGKGMCKTNDHQCKGLNDCKGNGGCKSPSC